MNKPTLIALSIFLIMVIAGVASAQFGGEGAFGAFRGFLQSGSVALTTNQNGSGFTGGLTIDGTAGKTGTCADGTALTVVSGLITACS